MCINKIPQFTAAIAALTPITSPAVVTSTVLEPRTPGFEPRNPAFEPKTPVFEPRTPAALPTPPSDHHFTQGNIDY